MKATFFTGLIVWALMMVCCRNASPQSIVAGQHGAGSYFVDIIPDTTLTGPNNHFTALPAAEYRIDINGDGMVDVSLYSYGSWVNGWGDSGISIQVHDTAACQVAYGYTDTCRTTDSTYFLYRMAKSFRMNDLIGRNQTWLHEKLFLAFTDWFTGVYDCSNNGFGDDSLGNYLGVRLIRSSDTLYGWIKVRDVSFLTFTVQEYAGSKNCTGVDESFSRVNVYPNPASDKVTIETGLPGADLAVYNPYGMEVLRKTDISAKTIVDLSRMAGGIYILRVSQGERNFIRKIVVTGYR